MLGVVTEVTIPDFVNKLWKLKEHGNPEDTYICVVYAIRMNKTFPEGKKITFDLIVKKYTQYLAYCSRMERGPTYIKSIKSWVNAGGYNESYDLVDPKLNDRYT